MQLVCAHACAALASSVMAPDTHSLEATVRDLATRVAAQYGPDATIANAMLLITVDPGDGSLPVHYAAQDVHLTEAVGMLEVVKAQLLTFGRAEPTRTEHSADATTPSDD